MISIIAGKYKGHKLRDLKNLQIRPTQAKVRKSIFQILEPIKNLEVLDMYAGVGTLGIEALSRGATKVVFVEKDHRVVRILKKNLQLFDSANCEINFFDVIDYLNRINTPSFDLVFADPPYSEIKYENIRDRVAKILKPNGIFCMEMKKQNGDYSQCRVKYYGSTQVVFWKNSK